MKLFSILLLLSTPAWSYPVFFKCEAGGRLSDQITPPEMRQRLNAIVAEVGRLAPGARNAKIEEYCEGGALCMQEFQQLLRMAEANGTVTQEIMNAELARVRAKAQEAMKSNAIAPVSEGIFQSALSFQKMNESLNLVRECRIAMANFPPEKFNNNGSCVLANFTQSPYMYVSGLRFSGTGTEQMHGAPNCEAIQGLVQGALAMDEDPYAALAISLMENGTDIQGLYLDPIGSVQTLGCPSTRGTSASHNMNSFQTFYNVQYGVRENPALIRSVQNLMKVQGAEAPAGESYLCNTGGASKAMMEFEQLMMGGKEVPPDVMAKLSKIAEEEMKKNSLEGCSQLSSSVSCPKPAPNRCCVKVPFGTEAHAVADKALTYSSLNKYLSSPLAENIRGSDPTEYPARRLQRFNGYSDAMGGAESVSAWRSGVNYYNTPAYGYQAMDFIMNSLWNNPFVKSAVAEAEAKLGKKSKSVLCQDRAPGVYTLEHDLYMQKHANSPRMGTVLARWNQNKTWTALPKRFQNILRNEYFTICQNSGPYETFCGHVRQATPNLQAATVEYFKSVYPSRRTVAQASRMDQGYSWTEMKGEAFENFLNRYKETSASGYSDFEN